MYYEDEIYGSLFGCPLLTRCEDCPFNEVDIQSIKGKVIWMRSLSMDKKESIIEHHLFCSNERNQK